MSLLTAFHRQCQRAPDHIAFAEGQRRFSYAQVKQQASVLGAYLAQRNIQGQRVVIALERGIDAAVAIISALGAGACYIPLDTKNPPSRLNFIVNDAAPHCVIGKGACPEWLETPDLWLNIDQPPPAQAADWPLTIANEETLAAILYTSGSTGAPKGVALSHRAMRNFADWASCTFAIGAGDRIASLAPFHFDLSVFDLFSSLSAGAAVHFVPTGLTLSPSRLTAWLSDQRISVFYTVPSLLGFIALKGSLADNALPDLKTILFAGEVFPTPQLKKLCELLPNVDFYNLYGPTETNVCCYWPVERDRLHDDQAVPIGMPACGAVLSVDATTGELRVKSANNLSGYWQHGRLTPPALSDDEFYATGDKVSLNERGEYCYHGRLDRMLKCSGYRVEPAEIESVIMTCPAVSSCAVTGIPDSASGRRPAAALVLKPGATLNDVVKTAKQRLPAYMHPCKFIVLESLPCLSNGKTDYQTLQQQLENS
ncbi:amino acid adenylation domain-containing protein [Methylomarinum sp. Ch1-1]|uniref:Amino acid adenylation domain-containing protein n=1 Tax=Methylomarinum roseum TaxID=3067653 RepID=A0AAU7NX89_9GAMM|nr:amino acid adenylation domain-containing protein [Methylomarinum sp. Ch1-1]MDP4522293.1 amino acid adenylation domain-containing protein [Methylomarinum sp. Ch1-1]